MPADLEPRRLLIAALPEVLPPLNDCLAPTSSRDWKAVQADSLEQARFLLQHQAWDVFLLDDSILQGAGMDCLTGITTQRGVPVVLLSAWDSSVVTDALDQGVLQWLPRAALLEHPPLLAATLKQVVQVTDLRRRLLQAGAVLQQSRRQVDQLVGLLWRTLPTDARSRWHSQRSMMERLYEEVERARRYGQALTLVLGEMHEPAYEEVRQITPLPELIGKAKRASDVAGQYGPGGIMLLLVHTPESGAVAFCRRLLNLFHPLAGLGNNGPREGRLCLGLASYSAAVSTSRRLLCLAEKHLEAAKTDSGGLEAAV